MSTLALALPWRLPALPRRLAPAGNRAELRIDVDLGGHTVDADLRRLDDRLKARRIATASVPGLDARFPGLAFRHREADGEHYVYIHETATRRLVGCTVFNRLIELDRRADRHLRGPHSKYAADWQGRGIATAVYAWALDAGLCLVSGPRQSPAAHGLWRKLARRYRLGHVQLRDRQLRWLGEVVDPVVLDDFHTRLLLLGAGWCHDHFLEATGCLPPWPAGASRRA